MKSSPEVRQQFEAAINTWMTQPGARRFGSAAVADCEDSEAELSFASSTSCSRCSMRSNLAACELIVFDALAATAME